MKTLTKANKLEKCLEHYNEIINFNEEQHTYTRKGSPCLSTTTLIGLYSRENFEKLSKKINMPYYAKIGTATHKAIEEYWEYGTVDNHFYENIEDSKKVISHLKIVKMFTEIHLASKWFISGMADVIGIDNRDQIFIIDWKTSSRPFWEHQIQNEIYRWMLIEMWRGLFKEKIEPIGVCAYTPRDHKKGELKTVWHEGISTETGILIKMHITKLHHYGVDYFV